MSGLLTGRTDELGIGLVLGVAATLACLAVQAHRRRRGSGSSAPVLGVALAVAGAAGIALTTGRPASLALPVPVPALAVAAGAVGLALADFDRRWRRHGLVPPLLAVAAAGAWAAVPDVETALVVLGVTVPMTLLGWPSPLVRSGQPPSLGVAGALGVAALFAWMVAAGAAGRPGAAVGGLACLGVLVAEPVARRLDSRRRSPLDLLTGRDGPGWAALAAQVPLTGLASRVVARPERATTALLLAALELGLAVGAGVALARRPWADRGTAP
jgi:hypothetical protein